MVEKIENGKLSNLLLFTDFGFYHFPYLTYFNMGSHWGLALSMLHVFHMFL